MSYLDELEAKWRQNGGHRPNPAHDPEAVRPDNLRGYDMCSELMRLYYLSDDRRLADAVVALMELGIVDEHWQFAAAAKMPKEKAIEDALANWVGDLVSAGYPLHRAAAMVAAEAPMHSASFPSAIKRLENLFRSRKTAPHDKSKATE